MILIRKNKTFKLDFLSALASAGQTLSDLFLDSPNHAKERNIHLFTNPNST